MFDWVFSVMKQMFQLFFDFMSAVELREGVTFWSLLLVFLIGGGIVTAVVRHIGGASLASAGVAAYDSYKNSVSSKERESYEAYKESRARNEQYAARYQSEKHKEN